MKKYFDYILIGAAILLLCKDAVGGTINGIKKSTFLKPYDTNGKTTFADAKNKSGVYLIKENGKIVYVGYSGNNLYRTLYRHFQNWNHTGQEVVSYKSRLTRNSYLVRVVYCTSSQAAKLESALIIKHQPRDNKNKLDNLTSTAEKHIWETYQETEAAPF